MEMHANLSWAQIWAKTTELLVCSVCYTPSLKRTCHSPECSYNASLGTLLEKAQGMAVS
jgi:hypothetical protein